MFRGKGRSSDGASPDAGGASVNWHKYAGLFLALALGSIVVYMLRRMRQLEDHVVLLKKKAAHVVDTHDIEDAVRFYAVQATLGAQPPRHQHPHPALHPFYVSPPATPAQPPHRRPYPHPMPQFPPRPPAAQHPSFAVPPVPFPYPANVSFPHWMVQSPPARPIPSPAERPTEPAARIDAECKASEAETVIANLRGELVEVSRGDAAEPETPDAGSDLDEHVLRTIGSVGVAPMPDPTDYRRPWEAGNAVSDLGLPKPERQDTDRRAAEMVRTDYVPAVPEIHEMEGGEATRT